MAGRSLLILLESSVFGCVVRRAFNGYVDGSGHRILGDADAERAHGQALLAISDGRPVEMG
jgi:hypothetical protein